MPKAEDTQVVLELTQYSLRALRAVGGTVEAGGECILENKAAVEALLDSVAPDRKTDGLRAAASIWPYSTNWYVSTDTEAMLDRSQDAMVAIAAARRDEAGGSIAYAACNATDGGKVTPEGMDRWVMVHSEVSALARAQSGLTEIKVEADALTPAALASVGAVATALRTEGGGGSVALWDLGAESSHVILVTEKGVQATTTCRVGVDGIFEAVQGALKLKFRGAGARLFFNDNYDFTDPGPKVAALIGPSLKEALAKLPPLGMAPALACLGLTGKQAWFVRELAAFTGLSPWATDLGKLASAFGIRFANPGIEALFSPASAGLIGKLGTRISGGDEWNPEWSEAEAPAPHVEAPPEPEEAPKPAAQPEPEPVRRPPAPPQRQKPSLTGEPAASPLAFSPKAARPAIIPKPAPAQPAPPASPSPKPPPARPAAAPAGAPAMRAAAPPPSVRTQPHAAPQAFPEPATGRAPAFPSHAAPPGEPETAARTPAFPSHGFQAPEQAPAPRAPSFPAPGAAAAEPRAAAPVPAAAPPPAPSSLGRQAPAPGEQSSPQPAPATPVASLPFEAYRPKAAAAPAPEPVPDEEEPAEPKSRVGFYVGVGVVAALVFAGIMIVVEAHLEKIKANDLEQQEALAHHVTEQRLLEAEQVARTQAEQIRKEMAHAIEITRKQTAEDTRKEVLAEVEAERMAKMPGTLLLATVPAGASVSIDGGPPYLSPVSAGGLAPGPHRLHVTLTGREPVDLATEIRGGKTTDMGTLTLASIYGSVELSSTPDGLEFALRPENAPLGAPISTGRTPATLGDIPHGAYSVTFSRPGCRNHVEKVNVETGSLSKVDTRYEDGSLELSSDPSGASVSKEGQFLGTTPLVLHGLTPKVTSFDLTLPGYDVTPISCEIPEGDTLKYSAELLRKDRIFKPGEVKTMPQSTEAPPPVLTSAQRRSGAQVVLSFVVRRDGSVTDVDVVSATDDDVARRCVAAVEKWQFRPATAPDDRTVDARIEMPFKFNANAP